MEVSLAREIFFVLGAALIGGVSVKLLKLQPIVGYIMAGIVFGSLLPIDVFQIQRLAEIGAILLLFSVGIELSLDKLGRVAKTAVFGAILQISIVTLLIYLFLIAFSYSSTVALILSLGFSLSSTAVVVKILSDKSEEDSLHGEIMIGWLLIQDLAVIPIMVILTAIASPGVSGVFVSSLLALGKALLVVLSTWVLGKLVAPFFIHKVAAVNSRELLGLSAMTLALGTALATSFFGISPALGAFLAGVVISESQENHAVFAETRPLRDIFVALFFVSLGFLVTPSVIVANLGLIFLLALFIIAIKVVTIFLLVIIFGYHGRTAMAVSFGLSQVGEFAFIIFSLATALGLFSSEIGSVGIATTLLTLVATPFLFKATAPVWRIAKGSLFGKGLLGKIISGIDRRASQGPKVFTNHIIICGYGRVGGWVGRALDSLNIPFVVIDYNQSIVGGLKKKGMEAIYGDPTEKEVMEAAGIKDAKVVILAIPDESSQEEIITYIQNTNPRAKIISRVHKDEAWEKMKLMKVDKLIQPEFEGAISMIRTILLSMGKTKEEINAQTKRLRLSHAKA
jgi:CPA2 family monovalent cation:H+ antiporter-2